MVDPRDIWRVVNDAARLVREGELVVFGSASLAFWLSEPPRSRDVDVWCLPTDRGDAVQALMGELSWYQDKNGIYVEVWAPETFAASESWRTRARRFHFEDVPDVEVWVPHPHDVLIAKLERMDPKDWDHADRILKEMPLEASQLDAMAQDTPHRLGKLRDPLRTAAFERNLASFRKRLAAP